ncbi:MAG TPA: VOC family protein [Salinibacter sp.]|nr:VOC family protein [Salinibacter sp.]
MFQSQTVTVIAVLSLVGAFGLAGFAFQDEGASASADPTVDVGVVVNDLEASLQFYREVLGMEQRRTIDITEDFGRRSGLTGGAPTEIRVLTLGDGDAATEWKLMAFEEDAAAVDESDITDAQGMQYITLQVDRLGPYLERARTHGIEPRGETPIALGDENHFLLLQAPEGTFVELIGPLKQ